MQFIICVEKLLVQKISFSAYKLNSFDIYEREFFIYL